MLAEDLTDVPIDVFGGYCPAIVPNNLPPGAANIAQDVMFPQTGVRTRGGLGNPVAFALVGAQAPQGSINGLKTYLNSSSVARLLVWDQLGNLFKEDPQGTLNLINSRPYFGLLYESQTLFGREYQAFFNALGGFDIPRQYDDTNWDRVSQTGPGVAPTAADLSFAIVAISRAATTGIITITLALPFGGAVQNTYVIPGAFLNISGVTQDASLVGQFPIVNAVSAGGGTQTTVTCWGNPQAFQISAIARAGGVVTATLSATPDISAGGTIIVNGVNDADFDGEFLVVSIAGNVLTWNQGFSPDEVSAGGALYIQNVTASVITVQFPGYTDQGPASMALIGDQRLNFPSGTNVTIAGTTPGGYNTTYSVSAIPPVFGEDGIPGIVPSSGPTTVIYLTPNSSIPTGASSGGTATSALPASNPAVSGVAGPAGSIVEGLHALSVAYVTRQGQITFPALVPFQWSAAGGFMAAISGIPTGPPNIEQRLLLFTPVISPPATEGTFYSLPTGSSALAFHAGFHSNNPSIMLIPDNATTTATIDFLDTILISGFQAEYLFSQIEIGECSAMLPYNARTVWLGERARVPNLINPSFDGGFNGNAPNGWNVDPHNGAGGGSALAAGLVADWGDAYAVNPTGNVISGLITQSAYQDNLNVPIIQPNTSYSVRVRLCGVVSPGGGGGGPLSGTVRINLKSASFGTTAGLAVPCNTIPSFHGVTYGEFIAPLTDMPLPIVPADLVIQVYVDNTLAGGQVIFDSIEVFPTLTPVNSSIARLSRAFNPESFDSVTGQVQVRSGDGQQLRAGFPLRNSLYLAKDHYLAYTTDDGVNEPSSWPVVEVSATVGICGPNAVDWNEEWACFAERSGFYVCWGSDPVKITPEIQYDASNTGRISWASINWAAAYTIWVRIDRVNKRILIGAPVNGSSTPNVVFMLDYQWLENAEDIASAPFVGYSQFTGKILGHGRGRRWALWNVSANTMCFAERTDGTAQPFFGGTANGNIFWQQDASIQGADNGLAIASQYQSYATPSSIEEQQYQLRAHRKLLGYLKFRAIGAGAMSLAVTSAVRSTILRSYTLSLNPAGDGERPVNVHGERFFLTVNTNAVGSWFQLEKWIPCLKKDSSALVRGMSS